MEHKEQFAMMKKHDPDGAKVAIRDYSIKGSTGVRDLSGLVCVISNWSRQRRIALESRCIELDHLMFIKHWQDRGRSDVVAEAKWKKATTPDKIASGWAWYVGKNLWVWQQKPRELCNDDILSSTMSSGSKETWTDQGTANRMLRGPGGIAINAGCRQLFGGKGAIDLRQMLEAPAQDSDDDDGADVGISLGVKDVPKKVGEEEESSADEGAGSPLSVPQQRNENPIFNV